MNLEPNSGTMAESAQDLSGSLNALLGVSINGNETPMANLNGEGIAVLGNTIGDPGCSIDRGFETIESDLAAVQSDSLRQLQEHIRTLQDEIKNLKDRNQEREASVNYEVFHCLSEHGGTETIYLGQPFWVVAGEDILLNAHSPVLEHEAYIRYNRSLAFVVYKHYSPSQGQAEVREALRQDHKLPSPEPTRENIRLISEEMAQSFEALSAQHPVFQKKLTTFNDMEAPYLWWYYYRYRNVLSSLEPRGKELISTLTSWIDANYSSTYDEADSQFKRGVVRPTSMKYLVRPGDVLVSTSGKDIKAALSTSWLYSETRPELKTLQMEEQDMSSAKNHEWSWKTDVWSYRYDGTFYQQHKSLEIKLQVNSIEEEVNIADLDVVPLRFAEEGVRARLERRGRTFWSCRGKKLVSYDSSTVDGTYSVSAGSSATKHRLPRH
jgi:hypothetical protein